MSRIYRTTDQIPIKIHDITVKISPLSLQQKNEILTLMIEGQKANDMVKLSQATMLALRFSLKHVEGIEDADGNEYKLEFENGMLTEQCTDDMLNMNQSADLTQVCAAIINGVPSQFVDQKGQPLEGVSFVTQDTKKKEQAGLTVSVPTLIKVILDEINKVSSLTVEEFVGLVASYHAQGEKGDDLEARGYSEEMIKTVRAQAVFNPVKTLNMTFSRPFREFEFDQFSFVATLFNQFDKHGTLPYQGSLTDQPNKIIEAFNVIRALNQEQETKQQAKQAALAKRKQR